MAAGATLTTIAHYTSSNYYPEDASELKRMHPGRFEMKLVKGALSYAAFLMTFEGLRRGIYVSRWRDSNVKKEKLPHRSSDYLWHITNFITGTSAGFAYYCATIPWMSSKLYQSPIPPAKIYYPLIFRGAVKMGLLGLVMGVTESIFNLNTINFLV